MYDTAKILLTELGANTDLLHDAPKQHNLWMKCGKLTSYGVEFSTTTEGLKKCLIDYYLTDNT